MSSTKLLSCILKLCILSLACLVTPTQLYSTDTLDSLTVSADSGNSYAQAVLGEMLRRGENCDFDYPAAYEWTKAAADAGEPIALYNLAVMYERGIAAGKDLDKPPWAAGIANRPPPIMKISARGAHSRYFQSKAKELFASSEKGLKLASERGDLRAMTNLGNIYEMQSADTSLYYSALNLYEQAAEGGYSFAQYILGFKYYYGSLANDKDSTRVEDYLRSAAEQGLKPAQYLLGNLLFAGEIGEKHENEVLKWFSQSQSPNTVFLHNGFAKPGDYIIPGLLPPRYKFEIKEGSCGEACLWTILRSKGRDLAQIGINIIGGAPGRGLRSYELHRVSRYYDIEVEDRMYGSWLKFLFKYFRILDFTTDKADRSRKILYEKIIPAVQSGHPVLLGVKRYPDKIKWWDVDHFILAVGYNEETDELVFNDFTERKRIKVEKLLDMEPGYSLLNLYGVVNYVVFK